MLITLVYDEYIYTTDKRFDTYQAIVNDGCGVLYVIPDLSLGSEN